jgi:hypothetical protein
MFRARPETPRVRYSAFLIWIITVRHHSTEYDAAPSAYG